MAMNPLPPQAYTKDTMLKAYAWLQNQNQNIKELATTPDILVSLFLKANRDGENSLDRPSIQNFKNELRNIAGLMGEFDDKATTSSASAASVTSGHSTSALSGSSGHAVNAYPASSSFTTSAPSTTHSATSVSPQTGSNTITAAPSATEFARFGLDTQSLETLKEVKSQLNLSSESEALRMLIRLGSMQISRMIK